MLRFPLLMMLVRFILQPVCPQNIMFFFFLVECTADYGSQYDSTTMICAGAEGLDSCQVKDIDFLTKNSFYMVL